MTKTEAKAIMREAFARLTKAQRARLRWHARQKTGICCGQDAGHFFKKGKG